jgi:hypothetical protein
MPLPAGQSLTSNNPDSADSDFAKLDGKVLSRCILIRETNPKVSICSRIWMRKFVRKISPDTLIIGVPH